MVVGLELSGRDIAQRRHQPMVVEPGHPLQRGQFHRLLGLPGATSVDHLGLVEPVDRLGQRVVVAVAFGSDGSFDTGLGETFRVADREELSSTPRSL